MRRLLLCGVLAVWLSGCGGEKGQPETAAASAVSAASSSKGQTVSSAAAAILNTPQQADILTTSKQALASASAADLTDEVPPLPLPSVSASATAVQAASEVVLPEICEQYFRRADTCFAAQDDEAAALQGMNQQARMELAAASAPSENECRALNSSFDAVAANLGCR